MTLEGRTLGDFLILREIGRGGMGVVYQAEQRSLGRRVALKVLPRAGNISPEVRARFRREAEAASRLDHPAICAVYATGIEDGIPWIAMRYVEGRTLSAVLAERRRLAAAEPVGDESFRLSVGDDEATIVQENPGDCAPAGPRTPSGGTTTSEKDTRWAVRFVEKAARALQTAHDARIIHRDIKPGNVMVTPEGDPVLLDFGLARSLEGEGASLTESGDLMGTPHYMSPEQISGHGAVDARTDVYSLGVTLFELLTLRRPFEAPNRERLYRAILHEEAPPLRDLCPAADRDLEIVVASAIERDLLRRYQTAQAFADDLRAVLEHEPIAARAQGPWHRLRKWLRRHPAAAVALLAVFVLLGGGLFGAWSHARRLAEERDRTALEKGRTEDALREREEALLARNEALSELEESLDRSRALRLAAEAQALAGEEPALALVLAREAAARGRYPETDRALRRALAAPAETRLFPALHFASLTAGEPAPSRSPFRRRSLQALLASGAGTAELARSARAGLNDRLREQMPVGGDIHWEARRVVTTHPRAGFVPVVWDLDSGGCVTALASHAGSVSTARFTPDGRAIVTAGTDGEALRFDTETGVCTGTLSVGRTTLGRRPPLDGAWIAPKGGCVLGVRGGATVFLWNLETGSLIAERDRYRVDSGPPLAGIHPRWPWIVGHVATDRVILWSPLQRAALELDDPRSAAPLTAFAFTDAGGILATGDREGNLVLWRVPVPALGPEPAPAVAARIAFDSSITSILADPEGRTFWAATGDRHLHAVQATRDGCERRWSAVLAAEPFGELTRSPDGRLIGVGTRSRTAHVIDAAQGRERTRFEGNPDWVGRIAFSPGSDELALFTADGSVRILPLDGPGRDRSTVLGGSELLSVEWSPDGQRLAVAGQDGRVRILDSGSLEVQATLPRSRVRAARWGPAGRTVYCLESGSPWLRECAPESGETLRSWSETRPAVRLPTEITRANLALSAADAPSWVLPPSGVPALLAAAGDRIAEWPEPGAEGAAFGVDASRRLAVFWAEGGPLVIFERDGDRVRRRELPPVPGTPDRVVPDPGGSTIALLGADGTLVLIDSKTGTRLDMVSACTAAPVFLDGGRTLVAAGGSGRLHILPLDGGGSHSVPLPASRIEALLAVPARRSVVAFAAGEIWVYELARRRLVTEVRAREVELADWDLCPDGERLAIAYSAGSLEILHLDPLPVAMRERPRRLTFRELARFDLATSEERDRAAAAEARVALEVELRALAERRQRAPTGENRLRWARRVLDPADPVATEVPLALLDLRDLCDHGGPLRVDAALLLAEWSRMQGRTEEARRILRELQDRVDPATPDHARLERALEACLPGTGSASREPAAR